MIPNIRWCTQTNRFDFEHCSVENSDDPATGGASPEFNISAESLTAQQIFDAALGISEGFVNYATVYGEALVNQEGFSMAMGIAQKAENKTAEFITQVATYDQVLAGNLGVGTNYGPGAQDTVQIFEDDYANYVNCSAPKINAGGLRLFEWENFSDSVGLVTIAGAPIDTTNLPPAMNPNTLYGDTFTSFGIPSGSSDFNVTNGADNMQLLVEAAVKCSLRDDVRLALTDYVAMVKKPESRDAALLGYRTQVAYAATRNVLNYLLHRLELAQLDLSMLVSTDPNSPPPYVKNALQTVINSIHTKVDRFEKIREQQKDYAKMISNIYK